MTHMARPLASATTTAPKRGKGRPVPGENDVGRERLIVATEKLLRTMPPSRVTIAKIAREADADPSLVYYYFGSRTALLVAVVDRVTAHAMHRGVRKAGAAAALADHIAQTVSLVRRAPFMHRLMIDELAQAGPNESRDRVRRMNHDLVDFYRELFAAKGDGELVDAEPLYLFVSLLGATDFLLSAEPLIRDLLPEGTDMETLTEGYQKFLVNLFLNGLVKK